MKRIFTAILTVCMIMGLASCTSRQEPTETEPETKVMTEAESKTETAAPQEKSDDHGGGSGAMGGTQICQVHDQTYHSVPQALSIYVGQDRANEWFESHDEPELDETGCLYPKGTVYQFIHDFDIPREALEHAYYEGMNWYSEIWDIDILLSEDAAAVDQLYRDVCGLQETHNERDALWVLKIDLKNANIDSVPMKLGDRNVLLFSLHELVSKFNVTREELQEMAERHSQNEEGMHTFDFDSIYIADGTIKPVTPTASFAETITADAGICTVTGIAAERAAAETADIA